MDCNPAASSVHGIFQERMLEWVAIFYSRGSPWPRDQTHFSCISLHLLASIWQADSLPLYCLGSHIYMLLFFFWLCWVFVAVCGLSLVLASGGYSLLRHRGFSLPWLLLCSAGSRLMDSGVAALGPRAQAQWLWPTGLVSSWHAGSSWPRNRTHVPCSSRQILNLWTTQEVLWPGEFLYFYVYFCAVAMMCPWGPWCIWCLSVSDVHVVAKGTAFVSHGWVWNTFLTLQAINKADFVYWLTGTLFLLVCIEK